jgi:glutaredoxin
MPDKFVVVGRSGCPWCDKAKDLLAMTPVEYEYWDISDRSDRLHKFIKSLGYKTVPQVFFNGELVGDYSDLEEFVNERYPVQFDLFDRYRVRTD